VDKRRGIGRRVRVASGRLMRRVGKRRAAWAALVLVAAAACGVSCMSGKTAVPTPTPKNQHPPVPTVGSVPADTDIRVLLVEAQNRFDMKVDGPCRVTDGRGRTVHNFPQGVGATPVVAGRNGIVFSALAFAWADSDAGLRTAATGSASTWIEVVPERTGSLSVEGKRYRGRLRILRDGDRLSAINVLDIEDYLPGVLRGELPGNWEAEAYKAQAVASRTFALYEKGKRSAEATFDVRATVASQVYHGDSATDDNAARGVAATRGQVLMFHGALVHAYFSSTCGGMNEPASICWPQEPNHQPLAGGAECSYCRISPKFRWGPVVLTKAHVLAKLRRRSPGLFGEHFGDLRAVQVGSRVVQSNRPATLRVIGTRSNDPVEVNAYEFRLWISEGEPRERQLFSSYFDVVDYGSSIGFSGGRGFGHGVGLCQWGAQGQAQAGRDYRQMLALYYPGAQLSKLPGK